MKPLRVALIGIAHDHAGPNHKSVLKQTDLFEVVGWYAPEGEKAQYAARLPIYRDVPEMTFEEILADPTIEGLILETYELDLTRHALLGARAGKHVFMDKPGGADLSEFEELLRLVREKNLVLELGYMYRYNPYVKELLQKVRSGALGEIISVEAQMNCFHPAEKRQWLAGFPGGMMFFLGCHLVDLVLLIQGEPKKILPMNRPTGRDGVTAEDFGFALLEYDRGVSFVKTNAAEMGGFNRRQLVVTGTLGTVEIKPFEILVPGGQQTQVVDCTSEAWADEGVMRRSEVFDRYDEMMATFAKIVRGEAQKALSLDYELTLYKTLLACCGVI